MNLVAGEHKRTGVRSKSLDFTLSNSFELLGPDRQTIVEWLD